MNEQQKWFALEISVAADAAEAVEFALNEMGALGTEIDILGTKKNLEIIKVVGYFNEQIADETIQNELSEALRIYNFSGDAIEKTDWRKVENKDWLAEWKKHWRPTETERFIVAPVWSEIGNTDKTTIRIEPSMAFGTGTHETTKLCLRAVEKYYDSAMSFFDVGTGTGILAIGASKMQSEFQNPKSEVQIVGCDTDEDSIKIAIENAELNDAGEIEFYVGSISEETENFDFVCANLTADVIVPLLPLLVKKFNRFLVLSGILKEQEDSVVGELKKLGVENSQIKADGEWIRILIESKI